jgi:RNA polymerase Rpb1, domain 1.
MNEHSWRELVGEERPVGFDQVAIGIASSDTMRSWSKGEVKNPETLIIARLNLRKADFSASGFLARPAIGSVRAENTSASSIKE